MDVPHYPYQFHRDFHNFYNSIHSHKISHFYEQINIICHPGEVQNLCKSTPFEDESQLIATSSSKTNCIHIWDPYNIRKNSLKDFKNNPHESEFTIEHKKHQEIGNLIWSSSGNSLFVSYKQKDNSCVLKKFLIPQKKGKYSQEVVKELEVRIPISINHFSTF